MVAASTPGLTEEGDVATYERKVPADGRAYYGSGG